MRFFANLHALLGRPRVVSRALGYRACSSTKDKRFVVYPSPGIINEQNKYFWAQFALPPITFSGVDQAPNQRLVFPSHGPSLQVVLSFIVVHRLGGSAVCLL